MPLVTRTSAQSFVYKQATAPTSGMQTGDVWIDTDDGVLSTYSGSAWVQQTAGALGTGLQVLRVNSGATALEYGSGSTVTQQTVTLGSNFTSSSASVVDVTGMTVTLPNRTNGKALVEFLVQFGTTSSNFTWNINDNGSAAAGITTAVQVTGLKNSITIPHSTTLSGQVVKLQVNPASVSITIYGTASSDQSKIQTLEAS